MLIINLMKDYMFIDVYFNIQHIWKCYAPLILVAQCVVCYHTQECEVLNGSFFLVILSR